MTKYDATFREYLLLNRDSVANMPSPPEREHRGQFFIDRSVGPPDQVAYVRLNAAGTAYEKAILYTPTDLLPIASVSVAALADGLLKVASGALAVTNNPEVNSLIVDGGFRMGGVNGVPTVTTGTTDGPGAGSAATITSFAGGDQHGEFTLNASGTTAIGQIFKVTFQFALSNANYNVIPLARNGNAGDLKMYLVSRATGSFAIGTRVAPTSGQNYSISYIVVGR